MDMERPLIENKMSSSWNVTESTGSRENLSSGQRPLAAQDKLLLKATFLTFCIVSLHILCVQADRSYTPRTAIHILRNVYAGAHSSWLLACKILLKSARKYATGVQIIGKRLLGGKGNSFRRYIWIYIYCSSTSTKAYMDCERLGTKQKLRDMGMYIYSV
jgi:hypothetical protein